MRSKNKARRGGPIGPHRDRRNPVRGLAARIISCRLRRGLSQEKAAGEIGVARVTLVRWESGVAPRGLYKKALEAWLKARK